MDKAVSRRKFYQCFRLFKIYTKLQFLTLGSLKIYKFSDLQTNTSYNQNCMEVFLFG